MNVQASSSLNALLPAARAENAQPQAASDLTAARDNNAAADDTKLRETFTQFVGETFFTQLIKAMRSGQSKPAYFHGGRGEEVFQGQLDQMLSERFAENSAEQFAAPMYELFQLNRR